MANRSTQLFKRLLTSIPTPARALALHSLLFASTTIVASATYAQQQSDPAKLTLENIVITATRSQQSSFDLPYTVNSVDLENTADKSINRTLPEALKATPGIMVQKTGHGQGSPFIRGFTGFRTLLLIDGIRVNNSIMRDGPNQYWNTVDTQGISRLEVVKGPSSALYGSDAVGGTVNAITKSPDQSGDVGVLLTNLYYRYASAEQASITHMSVSTRLRDDLSVMLLGTQKNFGNLKAGNGTDEQDKTGYDEFDGQIKLEYSLSPEAQLTFAYQNVDLDDAWRSHKTIYGVSWHGTTIGDEQKRVLDQDRELTYLQYHGTNIGFLDSLDISLSYQYQGEQRDRIKNDGRRDIQGLTVDTAGFFAHGVTDSAYGRWSYGVEYYYDNVNSFAKKYNADGSLNSVEIQGQVADEANYSLLGVYFQNQFTLTDSIGLILGARYTDTEADAGKVKDPDTGNKISISDDWGALTANAKLLYSFDEAPQWIAFLGVSQGFRAPNLSDISRFDSARSNEIETPAPDLDPEEFITFEIGSKFDNDHFSGQLAYFYTDIDDMIIRTPTGRIIDGDNEVTKKNGGNGFIHGLELDFTYRLSPQWTASAAASWMEGRVDTFPTSQAALKEEPIDRMMPARGTLGIKWESSSAAYWLETTLTTSQSQDKLSTRDQSDTQRIPPGGTPGFSIFNLSGGWQVNQSLELFAALENLSDKDYRIHGSGLNEPGRNFIIGIDLRL